MGNSASQNMADSNHLYFTHHVKRKLSLEPLEEEATIIEWKRRVPKEIVVLEEGDEPATLRKGTGTEDDPITLTEWVTGNVISQIDSRANIVISDDEDDDSVDQDLFPRDSSPLPLEAPGPSLEEHICDSHLSISGSHHDARSEAPDDGIDTDFAIIIDDDDDDDDDNEGDYAELAKKIPLWTGWYDIVKEEGQEDEAPGLTFSQDSIASERTEASFSPQGLSNLPDHHPCLELEQASKTIGGQVNQPLDRLQEFRDALEQKKRRIAEKSQQNKVKKRLFYYTYGPGQMMDTLKAKMRNIFEHIPEKRSQHDCWIYQGRLPLSKNAIRASLSFKHEGILYKVQSHFGFIAMLAEGLMTEKAKEGIIEEQWHASHLCGNWTCVNPRHISPEPGTINSQRNFCLGNANRTCLHIPRCLQQLKIKGDLRPPVPFTDKWGLLET